MSSQPEVASVVTSPVATATASNPFRDSAAFAGDRTQSANPYVSPSISEAPFATNSPVAGLTHQVISFDGVLRTSWELLKLQFGQVVLCGLLILAVSLGAGFAAGVIGGIGQAIGNVYAQVFFGIVQQVISFSINTYLQLGLLIFGLRLIRTGRASISDIFAGKPYLLKGMGLFLIITLIYYGAILLCLAPAVATLAIDEQVVILVAFVVCGLLGIGLATYVLLRMLLATLFLVDRNELTKHYLDSLP